MKQLKEMSVVSIIYVYYDTDLVVPFYKRFSLETLAVVLMNFNREGIDEYDKIVYKLIRMG